VTIDLIDGGRNSDMAYQVFETGESYSHLSAATESAMEVVYSRSPFAPNAQVLQKQQTGEFDKAISCLDPWTLLLLRGFRVSLLCPWLLQPQDQQDLRMCSHSYSTGFIIVRDPLRCVANVLGVSDWQHRICLRIQVSNSTGFHIESRFSS
jgi:hypothetical protein